MDPVQNAMNQPIFGIKNQKNAKMYAKQVNTMIKKQKFVFNVKLNIALFVMELEGNVVNVGKGINQ